MKTQRWWFLAGSGLAASLLAACTIDSKPSATSHLTGPLATSPAAEAVAKLRKGLTTAQVTGLLGSPGSTKPLPGELDGEIWSYPFRAGTNVRMIAVATQDVPAVNPYTGQPMTRPEPVYQNQAVDIIDTLHLLMVDGLLIEWRILRDEKRQFQ